MERRKPAVSEISFHLIDELLVGLKPGAASEMGLRVYSRTLRLRVWVRLQPYSTSEMAGRAFCVC
jgi:hypothetical protein